jgi:hypothetical protein
MRYDFQCPEGHIVEVSCLMSEVSSTDWFCKEHNWGLQRIYTAPVLSIPETSAVDVLNRHARGEGDPLPGYTQEQTRWMANEKARIQKQEKGQKPSSTPTRSFATGGPRPYYGPD